MKFSAIAAASAALLRCIHLVEAATPKLRASAEKADASIELVADAGLSSRERISQFVKEGQMFYILEGEILYEDPSKAPFAFTNVFWICQPTVAPDNNGDGMYDSAVAHANIYMPSATSASAVSSGGSNVDGGSNQGITNPFFATDGYTASWQGGYYDEKVVDFGDFTVHQIKGKEYQMYETSAPGTTGGLVSSGEGTWTLDTNHPWLLDLAKVIGTELTPEACADLYAKSWSKSHSISAEDEAED